jgi:hypothetical protein
VGYFHFKRGTLLNPRNWEQPGAETAFLTRVPCAQEVTVERGWTDKNNTEMYAAYMLQNAYSEQGYWEAKVEIRQVGTKRVFVVEPGRIYQVKRFDVAGLSDLPAEAMTDSPTCTRPPASMNGLPASR